MWQNTDRKGAQPEIADYIPGMEKRPEQSDQDIMEMCRMLAGGNEGEEEADPADLAWLSGAGVDGMEW